MIPKRVVQKAGGASDRARVKDYRCTSGDRLLHRIIFAAYPVQVMLADVEDHLLARQLSAIDVSRNRIVRILPFSSARK